MAFMSMNLARHIDSFETMYYERAKGDPTKADTIHSFYEEYFATMDLTADFYLETVDTIFQRHALPLNTLEVEGRLVDPSKICRTALLTVEGRERRHSRRRADARRAGTCAPNRGRIRRRIMCRPVWATMAWYQRTTVRERQIYPRVRAGDL